MTKQKSTTLRFTLKLVFLLLFSSLFAFTTACGCGDPIDTLALHLGLKSGYEVNLKTVQRGFESKWPVGVKLEDHMLISLEPPDNPECERSVDTIRCDFFIQRNLFTTHIRKGYRVMAHLDADGTIINIETAKFSSWFGYKISSI